MLTSQDSYRLRFDLDEFDGHKRLAEYETIQVSKEADKYRFSLGPYLKESSGTSFSTKDQDDDLHSTSCAA